MTQTDTGLHMRQRSRAFIVADASKPENRIVFINAGTFSSNLSVEFTASWDSVIQFCTEVPLDTYCPEVGISTRKSSREKYWPGVANDIDVRYCHGRHRRSKVYRE
jgi:hypothetical protein